MPTGAEKQEEVLSFSCLFLFRKPLLPLGAESNSGKHALALKFSCVLCRFQIDYTDCKRYVHNFDSDVAFRQARTFACIVYKYFYLGLVPSGLRVYQLHHQSASSKRDQHYLQRIKFDDLSTVRWL